MLSGTCTATSFTNTSVLVLCFHTPCLAALEWAQWFSERGVGPRLDILTLQQIDELLPVCGIGLK
jgi:hypothetical protein